MLARFQQNLNKLSWSQTPSSPFQWNFIVSYLPCVQILYPFSIEILSQKQLKNHWWHAANAWYDLALKLISINYPKCLKPILSRSYFPYCNTVVYPLKSMELEGSWFTWKIHGTGRGPLKSQKWDYYYNYIITSIKSVTMLLKSVPSYQNVLFLQGRFISCWCT